MAFDISALGQPLDNRAAEDIAADAVGLLQQLLPDWQPRNSAPEVVYLEAVALAVAEVVATGNDVVGAVEEYLLSNLYGIARQAGTVATGALTVTFDSVVSTTIPAGTSFLLADYGVELQAVADVTVTSTDTTTVAVATAEPTSSVNGVGAGAVVDVLDPVPNALTVEVSTTMSGGADPEDDITYLARARNRLARVTNSLVVAEHFSAYALETGLASNAVCIPAWDGAAIGTAGTDAGEVGVVVYGHGGQVSAGDRTALETAMQAITYAGATVNVVEAALQSVAVTTAVHAQPGLDTAVVRAAIETTLIGYLDPATWPFGETVRTTSLTALIAGVDGVDYVDSLTLPAADVTLDANEVAVAGTLSVSVT